MDHLNRAQAPLGETVWNDIDAAAAEAAKALLTGRRYLEVEGPYGLGLTTLEVGQDEAIDADDSTAVLGRSISVPVLRTTFKLSARRLAAAEQGQPLDLDPVDEAAEKLAELEEKILYQGHPSHGLKGLETVDGHCSHDCGDWNDLDQVLNDVIAAVTTLDEGGYIGPHALVLAPRYYNQLFRHYPGTGMLQVEHLRRLFCKGIYKSPMVSGGLVVDPRVGPIIIGQDVRAGFSHFDGLYYHLFLSASLVVRFDDPAATCVLKIK